MDLKPMAFKRMVLGLPHSAKDYASVAFTAELADLLGLDLLGLFAEDERLVDIARLSYVREFRLVGDGWQPLDAEQLARSVSQAASEARRLFDDAARSLRVAARFDLVTGAIEEAIGARMEPHDIIVVIEPRSAAERVSYQFRQFIDMALNAPSATLVVPSRISRHKGPVVVIAESGHDASVAIGLRVAEAVHERLLVLMPDGADEASRDRSSIATAVPVDWRPLSSPVAGAAELESILAMAGERLVVMSPGSDRLLPSRLPPGAASRFS